MKLLSLVSLTVAITCGLSCSVTEARQLLQVSFWHRHGARDAPILLDGNINWDFAMLTQPGAQMAKNLGAFLRERYLNAYPDFLPTDFPQFYEGGQYYGQTGVDGRCVQTGFGAAQGMMGVNESYNIPYLYTAPVITDYDLSFMGNYPNEQIRQYTNKFLDNTSISHSIFTREELNLMGQYLPNASICTSGTMDNYCASLAYDYAQCFLSNFGWQAAPGLETLFPKLLQFQALSNRFDFGWNKDDPYAPMGSDAYMDVKIMLDNAASILATSKSVGATATVPKINQYSTHDNDIAGLMSTLGVVAYDDLDVTYWVPRFTATITAEVYDDGNLTFWWSIPDQAHGSGYAFTEYNPLYVSCISASGAVYKSDECPIEDLYRFLNTSAPQWDLIPKGAARQCYLAPQDADACNYVGLNGVNDTKCAYYRQYCPANACQWEEGLVLDVANGYQCVLVVTVEERTAFWRSAKVAIPAAAGAFVGAIGIGILLAVALGYGLPLAKVGKESYLESS